MHIINFNKCKYITILAKNTYRWLWGVTHEWQKHSSTRLLGAPPPPLDPRPIRRSQEATNHCLVFPGGALGTLPPSPPPPPQPLGIIGSVFQRSSYIRIWKINETIWAHETQHGAFSPRPPMGSAKQMLLQHYGTSIFQIRFIYSSCRNSNQNSLWVYKSAYSEYQDANKAMCHLFSYKEKELCPANPMTSM